MTLAGQYLGHYHVLRQIGRGGMGEVYLAEDSHVTRQVAIKVVRNEQVAYPDYTTAQETTRLFQREMKSISQLDHSHILNIYDFGEEKVTGGSLVYMVMPYRPEGSLADWLMQRDNPHMLSPEDVGNLLTQSASALQHVHDRNIIHQDVKPSNFLVRVNAEHPTYPDLFLVDFGVARITTATSTASNSVRGTFTYMAPEQWSGAAVPATDQYALAIMVYQLLTGVVPFQGRAEQVMFQHMSIPPKAPSEINPRLSPALDAMLLRALAKRPEERFPSVSAFASAFRQALTYDISTATLLLKPDPYVRPTASASLEPTVAAILPQPALPPLQVASPTKSAVSPLRYIIGTLLVVGIILGGVFSFNALSAKYTLVPRTNVTTSPITTPISTKATRVSTTTNTSPSPKVNAPAPTTENTPGQTTIPYPTYSDAEVAIKYYYENGSDFRGKNIILSFDTLTYHSQTGPVTQPQFLACAQYTFALVSSPDVTHDTARHTFTFQYDNGIWSVIDMGNWNSC
ncbi:MAG: serine/threonine protein kinase [Ktedonobacteraceae bacterium]|nr:serine/threonine protein kinase [Ktedonobacteraceae bacterium]